jgi:hypothetical protein
LSFHLLLVVSSAFRAERSCFYSYS